jgi:hypothetical protein
MTERSRHAIRHTTRRENVRGRIRFKPRPGKRVLWNHASDFTPCGCTTHLYGGVPCVPVQVTAPRKLHRCLLCGRGFGKAVYHRGAGAA